MIEQRKEVQSNQQLPQKKSVFLILLFSLLTLGIYPAVWYIKRKPEFDNLKTQKKLSKGLAITYLILIITIILQITTKILPKINPELLGNLTNNLIYNLIFFIFAITLLTLHLTLAFNTRTIINQAWQSKGVTRKVSWFFTLIFSLFYLQYEINRTIENKENEKRIGPWVFFIIGFIIIPLIFFTLSYSAIKDMFLEIV